MAAARLALGTRAAPQRRPTARALRAVKARAAGEDVEEAEVLPPALEAWQKEWLKQNPGKTAADLPSSEPTWNADNLSPLSLATGGVSFVVLAGALWVANLFGELRSLSPEELEARFGDAPADTQSSSAAPAAAAAAAPDLS